MSPIASFSRVRHRQESEGPWPLWQSITALAVATAFIAWLSEFLVGSIEPARHSLGLTETFVGVVVIALVGNAAEHSTAVSGVEKQNGSQPRDRDRFQPADGAFRHASAGPGLLRVWRSDDAGVLAAGDRFDYFLDLDRRQDQRRRRKQLARGRPIALGLRDHRAALFLSARAPHTRLPSRRGQRRGAPAQLNNDNARTCRGLPPARRDTRPASWSVWSASRRSSADAGAPLLRRAAC